MPTEKSDWVLWSVSATKFKGLFETFNKGHPNGAAGNSNQPQSLDDLLSSSQTAQELQIMSLMSGHLPKRQVCSNSLSVAILCPLFSCNSKIPLRKGRLSSPPQWWSIPLILETYYRATSVPRSSPICPIFTRYKCLDFSYGSMI